MELPDLQGKNVVICEDDELSAGLLKELLSDTGASIFHFTFASDAVEFVKANPGVFLILMDIQLPDMSGLQATKIIKLLYPEMPVIIQSAYALDSFIKRSIEAGCETFIPKPIDSEKFYSSIKKILDRQVQL